MSLFKGVGQLLDYTFNSLDLSSGTNDIIIVRHSDGSLHSSPFNVRFGILKAPRSREKIVRLEVNGTLIPDTYMKIGEGGVAYWLVPKPSGRIPSDFLSSPPRSPKEGDPSLNNGSGSYSVVSAPISPPPEETTGCNIAFGETHCHEGSLSRNPAQNDSSGFSDSQQKKSCPQTALSDCPKHFAGVEMTHEILDQVDASLAREHSLLEMHQHLVVANTVSSENESIPKPFEPLHLCSEPSAWEADPPIMKPLPLENSSENLSIPILPIPATEDEYVDDDEVSNDFDDDTEEHGMWMISVTPLPEYLERMKLRAGKNVLRFILHSNLLGTQAVTAYAFLCEPDQKLVVSDVDGTITRSDVLGHILPTIGKDWTHDGLCDFYNSIAKNGYQLIYLTARSISQAEMTRNFLHSIVQKGLRLPEGPLLSAPDRIFTAFTRELITKTPHEFKIACLSSIRKAFPCNIHPFYAGLGNRVGDVIAYTAVGIPTHKVLIIDKRSTVHICNTSTSYASLAQLINEGFPANRKVKWEEYNAMYYWNSDPINYFQPGSEAGKSSSLQNRVTCHKTRAKSLLSSMTGNTASNPDFSGKRHACFVELDKFYLVRNLRTDCVLSVENGRAKNKTWVKLVRLPKTSLETSLICPRHLWKFEAVASATASSEMAVQSANSGNPTKGTFSSPLNAIVSGVGNSGLLEPPHTSPSIKCSGTVRYYVLRNVHTNKILNVSKGGTESGTRVWLHSNAVSAHSHFSLPVISRPLQRVRIVNKNSMRCLAPEQSTDLDHDLLNVHVSAPGYSSTYLAASWTNRQGPKQSEKVSLPAEKSVSVHGNDGTAQSFECSGDTSCERHHSSPSLHVCQTVREVGASSDDTSITWALQAVEDACVARSGHSCDSHMEIRKKNS